jgi:hypothetical protein
METCKLPVLMEGTVLVEQDAEKASRGLRTVLGYQVCRWSCLQGLCARCCQHQASFHPIKPWVLPPCTRQSQCCTSQRSTILILSLFGTIQTCFGSGVRLGTLQVCTVEPTDVLVCKPDTLRCNCPKSLFIGTILAQKRTERERA